MDQTFPNMNIFAIAIPFALIFFIIFVIVLAIKFAPKKKPEKPISEILKEQNIDDPLAQQVSWKPNSRGGANFVTRKLVATSSFQMEYKPSIMSKIFPLMFAVFGSVPLFIFFMHTGGDDDMIVLGLMGLGFFAVGTILFFAMGSPCIFDKGTGYFSKGFGTKCTQSGPSKRCMLLSDIHALQIVKELVHTKDGRYYSYEINLVRNDASRITVVDHAKLDIIRKDAETLSGFLGVPVWDGTYSPLSPAEELHN
jgi:hypothetical protein